MMQLFHCGIDEIGHVLNKAALGSHYVSKGTLRIVYSKTFTQLEIYRDATSFLIRFIWLMTFRWT